MNVVNGHLRDTDAFVGKPPTHGVYGQAGGDAMGNAGAALSQHWDFESAVAAAASLELGGGKCTVVCYQPQASAPLPTLSPDGLGALPP